MAADFDGDGDQDLASADGRRVETFRNDGEGRFLRIATHPIVNAHSLAAGDLDGDGDQDVVVGSLSVPATGGWPSTILRNNGNGTFVDVGTLTWPTADVGIADLALVDVDGDADLDLLTASAMLPYCGANCPRQNRLYANNGSGVFVDRTATQLPHSPRVHTGVATGDFDGDGDADLVFSVETVGAVQGTLRLFVNAGNGTFAETAGPAGAPATSFLDVAVGDLDGDGDRDLLAATTSGLLAFWNNGAGAFGAAASLPASPPCKTAILVDTDGDGDLDVLATAWDAHPGYPSPLPAVHLHNLGGGTFANATGTHLEASTQPPVVLCAFDSDGDGDADLVGGCASFDVAWHNDGSGHLLLLRSFEDGQNGIHPAIFGDVDGDGYRDLVTVPKSSPFVPALLPVQLGRNQGGRLAGLRSTLLQLPAGQSASGLALLDIDGDADLDLYVAVNSQFAASDRLLRNDGATFTDVSATALPAGNTNATAVLTADIDGDADVDLAIRNRLLRNDGTGSFTDVTASQLPVNPFARAAARFDADNDGDVDLLMTVSNSPTLLYLNDGQGTFTDATATCMPVVANQVAAVAFDADRDGDLDVVTGNTGGILWFLRNDGGIFVDDTAARLGTTWTDAWSLQAADLDDDGDLDLVPGGSSFVMINDGAGRFANPTLGAAAPLPRYPAVGDIDGDHDADVLVELGILRAMRHQLDDPLPPRLGMHGELRLVAGGVAPEAACLMLATGLLPTPIAIGPQALLRLDPGTGSVHSAHVLTSAVPTRSVRYLVPNQATLLGAQLFVQAAFVPTGPPSRWRASQVLPLLVRL